MANFEKIETNLKDCFILIPKRFGDDRGYFSSVTAADLSQLGFNDIVQVSNSLSNKGILRGLHFQLDPYCQAKAVRCHQGAVLDVVVDLREDSPTYKQYTTVELTPENGKMLYVPRGFAHGFVSLQDNTLFEYYVDNEYKTSLEGGIHWCDPEIGIDWQTIFGTYGIEKPILSEKDRNRKPLSETKLSFRREPRRYFITGVEGQLGYDVVRELHKRGEFNILAPKLKDLDITNREQVLKMIEEYKPDVIFHCAAWTAVDKAESEATKLCYDINAMGTKNISDAAKNVGAKLVYISTDYVYDGKSLSPHKEDELTNPLSIYGKSKYLGEVMASQNPKTFIARTSWVFGINGNNFVKTMVNLGKTKEELSVVSDQIGSPTYTVDLAKEIVEMAHTEKYGVYHVTNRDHTSWAGFSSAIMRETGSSCKVKSVTTEEYYKGKDMSFIAERPKNSVLSSDKLVSAGFPELPSWEDALSRYLDELYLEKNGVQRKHIKGEK